MGKKFVSLLVALLAICVIVTGCTESSKWDQPEVLKIIDRTPVLNASGVDYRDNLILTFNFPIDTRNININDLFASYGSDHTAGTPDLSSAELQWSTDQKTLIITGLGEWLNPTSGAGPRVVELVATEGKIKDIFGNEVRPGKTLWEFTLKDPSIVWTRTYDDADNSWDEGYDIAVDGSGNVYVTGYETVSGQSGNIWIRKYDRNGNEIWTKTHNGTANDWDGGRGVAVDSSGNVYVVGAETVTGQSGNIWIRKYDRDGNEIWTKTHNGTANDWDEGYGIALDSNSNVYVAGAETVTGQSGNIWIRKYDRDGNEIWTKTHNGAANDSDGGRDIAVDESGNVYVTGYERITGPYSDIWVGKYDANGNEVWTKTCDGISSGNDRGYGVAVDGSGSVYVTGFEFVIEQSNDIWIKKYDKDGNEIWTRTYNGNANNVDSGYDIVVDEDGNIYVTGSEFVTGQSRNIWIRKYDGDGNGIWTTMYNSINNRDDEGSGIAVDEDGNIYVTGYERITGPNSDTWTRKYQP